MGKYNFAIWATLAATVGSAPAFAQDVPAAAKEKPKAGTLTGMPGAASASYARCAPGSPIGGIVVKGGVNPTKRTTGEPEADCPSTGAAEPAEGKGRTYTGGRRNEGAPAAAVEAGAPPAPTGKTISEKGVPASKPH